MSKVETGKRTAFRTVQISIAAMAISTISFVGAPVHAQSFTPAVSVCTGASLQPSALTTVLDPVVTGLASPIEDRINSLIGVVSILGVVPPLSIDTSGILTDATDGSPISLDVLDVNGNIVSPSDECNVSGDSFTLDTQGGISIGGNRITGLGADGETAFSGHIDAIAFGNGARAETTAEASIAFGANSQVSSANSVAVGDATAVSGATGTALGSGASVTADNSVALGANSTATRGPQLAYVTVGLDVAQDSFGEVSVGSAGAERQITNLAAGSAPTDAVNVAQLQGVADDVTALGTQVTTIDGRVTTVEGDVVALDTRVTANESDIADVGLRVDTLETVVVRYDSAAQDQITLGGAAGTRLTNLADASLSASSTDAVNGSQLFATNQQVAANTDAIANLTFAVGSGGGDSGPVQYADPSDPTSPNDGTATDDATLVGASGGPVRLHNVADGEADTDAVNMSQLQQVAAAVDELGESAVQYDDATQARVTLAGSSGTTVSNVAAGALTASSTDAVNGSQLYATNQQVDTNSQDIANNRTNIATNTQNITNNSNEITNIRNSLSGSTVSAVQYSDAATPRQPNGGTITNNVTLVGADNGPVALHNVAAGTSATDAVNLGQLQNGLASAVIEANTYTDVRLEAVNTDIRELRRHSSAGTAGALAAAALPQAMDAGRSMLSLSIGQYRSEFAWAMGASTTFNDGQGVFRIGGTIDTQGYAGANAGVGLQF